MSTNRYFEMLWDISDGKYSSRQHLERKYSKSLYQSALENGYIIEVDGTETDDGDVKCAITSLGKKICDER